MSRRTLAVLLAAGALVRACALPLPGTIDVESWKIWSFAGATDPAGLYGVGGTPPERRLLEWNGSATTTDYPPLALYEIALVGRLYQAFDPLYRDSPALTALLKVPGLLAEALFVVALLTWGRRRHGAAAEWTAVAFWLNPAIVLNGSVLGYLDAEMAVPAALALMAAADGRSAAAGMLAACAGLTKAQAIFALPAVAVALLRRDDGWRSLLRAASWGALTAAIVVLPIVFRGAWPNMLQALGSLAGHDMVSGHSLNVWWILTWIVRSLDSVDLGWWTAFTLEVRILRISDWLRTYPDPRPLATLVVMLAIAWGCWRSRRAKVAGGSALLGAWCVYAYTMFAVSVHENHLYPAVPFMLLAGGLDPALRPLAWATSLMAAINMYVFYGLGQTWPPFVDRAWTGVDLTVWLAAVNVGVFVWATRAAGRLWRSAGAESASSSDCLEPEGPFTPAEVLAARARSSN